MSERGHFRGGPRARGGGERGGPGGGGRGGRGGGSTGAGAQGEKPKKENILDLGKHLDREIRVKFTGGREVSGVLKGFDQLMNLVLDEVKETMRDEEGNVSSRPLGLLVARGTLLTTIAPVDGSEEIANPFLEDDAEQVELG